MRVRQAPSVRAAPVDLRSASHEGIDVGRLDDDLRREPRRVTLDDDGLVTIGISQFAEQVNYQRGLEGELARTIQSIGAVSCVGTVDR